MIIDQTDVDVFVICMQLDPILEMQSLTKRGKRSCVRSLSTTRLTISKTCLRPVSTCCLVGNRYVHLCSEAKNS